MDPGTTLIEAWGPIGAIMVVLGTVIGILWKAFLDSQRSRLEELKEYNDKLITVINSSSEAIRGQTTATNSLGEVIKNSLPTRRGG